MTRQVSARKANGSEPRMLCRKRLNRYRNQLDLAAWDQVQQEPVYGLDGDPQIGGANLAQAFMRSVALLCQERDPSGDPMRVETPTRSAGGSARSSDEARQLG